MATKLCGQTALITGASMGIGEAIALALAGKGMNVALFARSKSVRRRIKEKYPTVRARTYPVDVQSHKDVDKAVASVVSELGEVDILVTNAGLALGTPNRFWELPIELVNQMNGTNIAGVMYTTHAVLNRSMWPRRKGTIINISSVTGLECPPFNGEAVYHANKASLRPGCVVSHFHLQRVKYDKEAMDEFFYGYEPLVAEDLAESVLFMVSQPGRISIKAPDCVPSAQRSLSRIDRECNSRREKDSQP
ncbi:hypothetical protein BDW66DRAFT_154494 [Aspergillus desertorum]